ncbi:TDP-N-acetylfucosamine:lipid II N-acetylfucosaminyltransferase [uncultured Bacteroides sp.]|uniref:TDP-N-acetylfucosamine:lipid II N-acetylfucosaminyltransferase n=1 Tax=uncultured Bacteroides sp. TaxID=162156 RepID=UPI002629DA80|nr:TDP-N-acetylfucosamine:lipid II N-acetylfucosaminyltransferase [uncultured Bacteroides sp.]
MQLHLFDDEKVVNRAIDLFEKALPNQNIYICFVGDIVHFVNATNNLYFYKEGECFQIDNLKNVNKIIIHNLSYRKVVFINTYLPQPIPCYWNIWGGDLYNTILEYRGCSIYYEPRYLGVKYFIRKALCYLNIYSNIQKTVLSFIKNRVTHFVTSADYDTAKQYIRDYITGVQVTGFRYYPIDVMLGELVDKSAKGNVLLLGNSASFTNNHSYAFKYLSNLDLKDKKIVVPLSYGGSLKYINHIIKQGKRRWGDFFVPLQDFLSLDKYNQLLTTAEICIFSSWRQEAFGNIVIALYLGAKVFLSERSSLLNYFRSIDVVIYPLEQMRQEDIDFPLSDEIKESNRKILFELLNEQVIVNNIRNIWGNNK